MARLTERQAAAIERRIEALKYGNDPDHYAKVGRMLRDYWDQCGLHPDTRSQLERDNRAYIEAADAPPHHHGFNPHFAGLIDAFAAAAGWAKETL